MATGQQSLATNDSPVENKVWLVVEDDAMIRQMFAAMISLWHHTPLVFADGFEAMAWLDSVEQDRVKDQVPELAILDIRMPGPQGYEIAQRMRQLEKTARTPIVLITAFRFDGDERKMIDDLACPDIFLSKPLPPPDRLRQMFEGLISATHDAHLKAAASEPSQNAGSPPE